MVTLHNYYGNHRHYYGNQHHRHSGGGSNPQCLPLDPNFLTSISSGVQGRDYIYGAEYYTYGDNKNPVKGVHLNDVPCAICHISNRTAVYMVPAKYTCPTGWTREYYGYLMSEWYGDYRLQYTCVDKTFKVVPGSSSASTHGMFFHFVEGRCGSLPCLPYDSTRELSCAICTK